MKEHLDGSTRRAIKFNSDGATKDYYKHIKEGRLTSTCCDDCQHIPFPPRAFCPKCGSEAVQWVDLPKTGKLYAFTTQGRGFRFLEPDVIGLVEFEKVGLVFGKIEGKLEDLSIGQEMRFEPVEVNEKLSVPGFKAV